MDHLQAERVYIEGRAAAGARVVLDFPTTEHAQEFVAQLIPNGSTVIKVDADADPPFILYALARDADDTETPPEVRIPLHPAVAYYLRNHGTGSAAMKAAVLEQGRESVAEQFRNLIGVDGAGAGRPENAAAGVRVTRQAAPQSETGADPDGDPTAEQLEIIRSEANRVGMSVDAIATRAAVGSIEDLTAGEAARIIYGLSQMLNAEQRRKMAEAAGRTVNDDPDGGDQTPPGPGIEDVSQDPADYETDDEPGDTGEGLRPMAAFIPEQPIDTAGPGPQTTEPEPHPDDWLHQLGRDNDDETTEATP